MMKFFEWAMDRAKELSTWKGIALVLTSIGINVSPESWQAIVSFGIALAGLFDILTKEKKKEQEQKPERLDERLNNGG